MQIDGETLRRYTLGLFGNVGRVPLGKSVVADRVFISFASADKSKAAALCAALERSGLRCWVSFRDVQPGQNYQGAIVQTLETAKAMVLVFSSRTNESEEVSKELSLASAFKVPVIPLRVENALPKGALHYELATRQWVDAFDGWEAAMAEIVAAIGATGDPTSPGAPAVPISPPNDVKVRISEQAIETARMALTVYIGPIARVLARKEAAVAASLDDFYERLARQIQSSEDRSNFLSRMRRTSR